MQYKVNMYQADITGCGYMRVELVAKYLNKTFKDALVADSQVHIHPQDIAGINPITQEKIKLCDLIVAQRQHTQEFLAIQQAAKQEFGIPSIYELDDSIHHLHPSNPAYSYYFGQNKTPIVILEKTIRASDAMTVSTEYLKKMHDKFNKHIYVLPNCIDYEVFSEKNIKKHDHGDEIWIGWAGSSSHIPDLTDVVDAVRKIIQEFPQTKLAIGGFDGHYLSANGKKRYLWEGVPYDRTVKIHWVQNMNNYPTLLSHFDIALAPLLDMVFNRCKSNLKFLEYSACGIPVIASAVEPYSTTIRDGHTGLLIPTKTSSKKETLSKYWYNAIKSLILNEQLRRQLADNARTFVKQNYDMSTRIYDWFEVYKEVIERNQRENCK